jgi:hypothetical protein
MTPLEVRDTIIGQIDDNYSASPVAWPNRAFNPEKDAPGGHWIKINILMNMTTIAELGTVGLAFRHGIVKLQVFGPKGKDVRTAWANAGSLEDIFRRQVLERIVFDEPSTTEVGADDEFYQLAVDVGFTAFVNE